MDKVIMGPVALGRLGVVAPLLEKLHNQAPLGAVAARQEADHLA